MSSLGSDVRAINTVFRGNSAPSEPELALMYSFAQTEVSTSYCNVQGGESGVFEDNNCTFNWQDNIDADPLFVDPGSWDDNGTAGDPSDDIWNEGEYHLSAGSPCIDAGTSDDAPELDFDGNPRYDDPDTVDKGGGIYTYYDMGAFEYGGGAVSCPADLEGDDGDVDGSDLASWVAMIGDPGLLNLSDFAKDFGKTVCP